MLLWQKHFWKSLKLFISTIAILFFFSFFFCPADIFGRHVLSQWYRVPQLAWRKVGPHFQLFPCRQNTWKSVKSASSSQWIFWMSAEAGRKWSCCWLETKDVTFLSQMITPLIAKAAFPLLNRELIERLATLDIWRSTRTMVCVFSCETAAYRLENGNGNLLCANDMQSGNLWRIHKKGHNKILAFPWKCVSFFASSSCQRQKRSFDFVLFNLFSLSLTRIANRCLRHCGLSPTGCHETELLATCRALFPTDAASSSGVCPVLFYPICGYLFSLESSHDEISRRLGILLFLPVSALLRHLLPEHLGFLQANTRQINFPFLCSRRTLINLTVFLCERKDQKNSGRQNKKQRLSFRRMVSECYFVFQSEYTFCRCGMVRCLRDFVHRRFCMGPNTVDNKAWLERVHEELVVSLHGFHDSVFPGVNILPLPFIPDRFSWGKAFFNVATVWCKRELIKKLCFVLSSIQEREIFRFCVFLQYCMALCLLWWYFSQGWWLSEWESHILAIRRPRVSWRRVLLHWNHTCLHQIAVHFPDFTGKNWISKMCFFLSEQLSWSPNDYLLTAKILVATSTAGAGSNTTLSKSDDLWRAANVLHLSDLPDGICNGTDTDLLFLHRNGPRWRRGNNTATWEFPRVSISVHVLV